MPLLATAVTIIECDGHHGTGCPDNTAVEYPYPQSVAIRLARQSGWTVWVDTMCPECTKVPAMTEEPAPDAPAASSTGREIPALMVLEADAGEDALGWCARMKTERRRIPVFA